MMVSINLFRKSVSLSMKWYFKVKPSHLHQAKEEHEKAILLNVSKKKKILFYWNWVNSSVISFHKYLFCFCNVLLCSRNNSCNVTIVWPLVLCLWEIETLIFLSTYFLYSYTALHFPLFVCKSCSHWMTLNALWSFYNLLRIFHNIQRNLTWNKIRVLTN